MELPDSFPSYTGPYISDGKLQESVEFGSKQPKDELDALSRLHDSAYAKWDDKLHRRVADTIYAEEANKLVGKFPELAAFLVQYGNQTASSAGNLATRFSELGPFGILVGGVENMYDLNNYLMNKSKTRKEILDYYATDPYISLQGENKINKQNIKVDPFREVYEEMAELKNNQSFTNPFSEENKTKKALENSDFIEKYGSLADKRALDRAKLKARLPPIEDPRDLSVRTKAMVDGKIDERPVYYYPYAELGKQLKHLKRRKRRQPLYL